MLKYHASGSPNNSYVVSVDGESQKSGSLLEDFKPAVNPPAEIGELIFGSRCHDFLKQFLPLDDPEDFKPEDWVDEARIPDPEATKVRVSSNVCDIISLIVFGM